MNRFNYTNLQATAERLIERFGQTCTIKRITPPDPVLGGDGTPVEYTAKLVPTSRPAASSFTSLPPIRNYDGATNVVVIVQGRLSA